MTAGVDHPSHDPSCPGWRPVTLDIEAHRIRAVRQGCARVGDQLGNRGAFGPTLCPVDRDRFRHCRRGEAGSGVGPLGARECGPIAIAHHCHDVVDARRQHEELLIDDALVGAQRLLEVAHPHLLIAPDLPHRGETGAVDPEGYLHMILGDELRPPTLKRKCLIRERDRDQGERGVGDRAGEIAHGRDEGQCAAADERAHRPVNR